MSRCEVCRSKSDCKEWCGKNIEDIYDELQTALTIIKERDQEIEILKMVQEKQ